MNIEFRNFEIEKHTEILQLLLRKAFPEAESESAFSKETLKWKFSDAARGKTCFLGFCDGQPASFYGVLPRIYTNGEDEHIVGLVVDVLTAPEFQGKGLFVQSGQHALNCLELTHISEVIGFPIRPEVLPGHLKVGWSIRFSLPVYVYPVGLGDPIGLKRKMSSCMFRVVANVLSLLRKTQIVNVCVLDYLSFVNDPAVTDFYKRREISNTVSLKRSQEYLKWRLSRPNVEYVCFRAGDSHVSACAIVRILNMNGFKTAAIVDIDSESELTARAVAEKIIDFASENRVDLIGVCMNRTLFKKLGLKKLGFLPSFSRFKVISRKTKNTGASLYEAESRITWLDSDTV